MGTCKNCKYWSQGGSYDDTNYDLTKSGKCGNAIYMIYYMQFVEDADMIIEDGNFGGDNLWTNENFGCINFKNNAD